MRRIPYIVFTVFTGSMCIARIGNHSLFIWLCVLNIIFTGAWYIISVLAERTEKFHMYIGWSWIILPIPFTLYFIFDQFTSWNRMNLFVLGLCIGILSVHFWIKDKNTARNKFDILSAVGCLIIAGAVGFSIMLINESAITDYEFDTMELIGKEDYQTRSWGESMNYYLYFDYSRDNLRINTLQCSGEYYDSLKVGDTVPVCFCKGLLGKEFYFLYEEPEEDRDIYGLNEWAREKVSEP